MNTAEIRTLRGQVILTVLLVGGCVAASIVVAANRWWFEGFLYEKYDELPARLKDLAESAAVGAVDKESFSKLSGAERLLLYDDWIERTQAPRAPAALAAADADLYLSRAERTLVCGDAEQRRLAARFLALCGTEQARDVLRRARAWARRTRRGELAAVLDAALAHPPAVPATGAATRPATGPASRESR